MPEVGGSSPITVVRAGTRRNGRYVGIGSSGTIHTRSETTISEPALIKALRVSINLEGDGYIEAIPDRVLMEISDRQSRLSDGHIRGQLTQVTLPESRNGARSIGRFGWKDQHGSLVSAVAEALYSELGVPNAFFPGTAQVPSSDIDDIVKFLRASEPIAPDPDRAATASAIAGSILFEKIGCGLCHVESLRTALKGETTADGATLPERLADREVHPYSDFLLHDVGTGDGIVQNIRPQDYDETTANKFRTAPLWGVRFRSWLMHDGKSITYHQAIMRHGGEASGVVQNYLALKPTEKLQLRQFLDSL